jgi:hypothetical protein
VSGTLAKALGGTPAKAGGETMGTHAFPAQAVVPGPIIRLRPDP